MDSITKMVDQITSTDTVNNTVISTDLYNRNFIEEVKSDVMIDTDCQQFGTHSKKQRIHLNLELDETLHDWVKSQGINYHLTISKLISQAMAEQHLSA